MKRYRDCVVHFNNAKQITSFMKSLKSKALSLNIEAVENGSSVVGRDIDSLDFRIKSDKLPLSRVFVLAYRGPRPRIEVANIIPTQASGVTNLNVSTYNEILDIFIEKILSPVCKDFDVKYESNDEHYSIKEYIPKSFEKLDLWLKGFPLSCHPMDEARWFDFIVALVKNEEELSISTFEEYIVETQKTWTRNDIECFSEKLEYSIRLLKHYINGDC